ncbi:LysE family transporter [Streptomyces sp. TRM49041]|uniref:LysE family translocator n=1 Tax=Streptomyces sp. TRM49041 TaxID=2603216 RepID=UPI0011EEC3DD|nr:LysE family transporter [Streptomyces sp. TRM49041]
MAPGPDLALITRLVLNHSLRVAAAGAVGMILAGAGQAALGAAGLAALLAARPGLFTAFRWAGAAVLFVWACLALRAALRPATADGGDGGGTASSAEAAGERGGEPAGVRGGEPAGVRAAVRAGARSPVRSAFVQGLLCTGSNPKVGMFLMAFLPQFVPPGVDPAAGVAALAACYLAMGLLWLLIWMRLVHRLARYMHSARMTRITHGLTAAVFGVFAFRLALGG